MSAYDHHGSPRNQADYIEIDVDNMGQMAELSKDVVELRKRKQAVLESKMATPGKKSVMRNPTSKGTISTKTKFKSKASLADKSRTTF